MNKSLVVKFLQFDTIDELDTVPSNLAPGSKAFISSSSTLYLFTPERQWTELDSEGVLIKRIVYDGGEL